MDWWKRLAAPKGAQNSLLLTLGLGGLVLLLAIGVLASGGGRVAMPAAQPAAAGQSSDFNVANLGFQMFLPLVVVLGLVYLFFYFLRRWQGGKLSASQRRMSVVEKLTLSPRQSVCLLQVGERQFLVGVTDQAMSLLAELDSSEDQPEPARAAAPPPDKPSLSFAALLKGLQPGQPAGAPADQVPTKSP